VQLENRQHFSCDPPFPSSRDLARLGKNGRAKNVDWGQYLLLSLQNIPDNADTLTNEEDDAP
jgi:hypothetical protein